MHTQIKESEYAWLESQYLKIILPRISNAFPDTWTIPTDADIQKMISLLFPNGDMKV